MAARISGSERRAAAAFALAALLAACSGGGGGQNVRPPAPLPPPPPTYSQADNQLIPTGAQAAQQLGFAGAGVKIGVLDSGVDTNNAAMQGRISGFHSYLAGGNSAPNDVYGHGSVVAQILGGQPVPAQGFPGGVATQASLYFGQVCDATNYCKYAFAQQALNALLAQGVRLFNESFGAGDITTMFTGGAADPYAQAIYAEFSAPAQQGALQVFSAGNDGQPQPEAPAGLPYVFPNLQPNWLAVVNITIDSNGRPGGLYAGPTDPSNACGVAAMWCLAAPGEVNYVPIPGTQFGGYGFGTSFAAPAVTGIAAQLWQAFPWMSASNVQQTLLTTATDLGAPGVDAVYGWGLVNGGKAVRGPAQFAFGAFSAVLPAGISSTFANDIGGSGSLLLQGQGNLILSGRGSWSGGATVAGGTLTVNGSVASDVAVQAGGTLNGSGMINANVSNAGNVQSVAPMAASGLGIAGNYTALAGSTTAVALGDPLRVGGTATLAGTMLALAPPGTYIVQSTETLLTAQAIAGSFGNFSFGSGVFYSGTLSYSATAVSATLARTNVALTAAALPNVTPLLLTTARHVQGALLLADQWTQQAAPGHGGFLGGAAQLLAAPDAPSALVSLGSLSGEIHGSSRALEVQQASLDDRALAARMDELARHADAGAWAQASGAGGTLAERGYSGADYRLGGGMLGVDGRLGQNAAGGIALGHSQLDASFGGLAGRVDGRSTTLALYGRLHLAGGDYLAARLQCASLRVNVRRVLLLGHALTALASARDDTLQQVTLEAGRDFPLARGTLTPYLDVSVLRLQQGGFSEPSAGGFGLTARGNTHALTQAMAGLRYGTAFHWLGGDDYLAGYAAIQHVLTGANPGIPAAFTGAPTATFELRGQNLARRTGLVGVNLLVQVNRRWSWFLDAAGETARGQRLAGTLSAGVRIGL